MIHLVMGATHPTSLRGDRGPSRHGLVTGCWCSASSRLRPPKRRPSCPASGPRPHLSGGSPTGATLVALEGSRAAEMRGLLSPLPKGSLLREGPAQGRRQESKPNRGQVRTGQCREEGESSRRPRGARREEAPRCCRGQPWGGSRRDRERHGDTGCLGTEWGQSPHRKQHPEGHRRDERTSWAGTISGWAVCRSSPATLRHTVQQVSQAHKLGAFSGHHQL